ncbi:MAG: Hpt domain-containing protein [Bacteroidota bacterium]
MSGIKIDLTYLNEACGSDSDSLKELISLFVSETPKNIETIQASICNSDWNAVRSTAHKLKSSFRIFGLNELSENFANIEKLSMIESEQACVESLFNVSKAMSAEVVIHLKTTYSID